MLTRVLDGAFRACLVLFVVGGILIVALQGIGLVTGSGNLIVDAVRWLGTPTYVLAGVTGLLGFALSYLKGWSTED